MAVKGQADCVMFFLDGSKGRKCALHFPLRALRVIRFAKALSDTNEPQRMNYGVGKKEFQTEKTSNLIPKT